MLRTLIPAAAIMFLTGAALAAELVPPADLERSFFDATPITTTDAKGRASKLSFSPGGTMIRTSTTGRTSEGKWRLSDDGFCMQVGSARRESCYIVLRSADGTYSALKRSGQPFIWSK